MPRQFAYYPGCVAEFSSKELNATTKALAPLLDIELLTIKLRLLVVSVDKAEEMGIDWWRHDPMLTVGERGMEEENRQLRERVAELEGRGAEGEGEARHDG